VLLNLAAYIILFGMLYGAVMGSFGGFAGERLWQVLYSALKVPLLLLCTFAISLPSFFVLNSLFGLRDDFGQAIRSLAATQAGLAIVLSSLAPFTALWYLSTDYYNVAYLFNGCMFAIASFAAQRLLRHYYRSLIEKNLRHRYLLWLWVVIYAFVGIQMGWVLRPFIGDPSLEVQFFREGDWGNAYVVVFNGIWGVLTGR
ncbi:MAG: hypothetical protein N2C12_12940, partial [Planctomycetales bacterium]